MGSQLGVILGTLRSGLRPAWFERTTLHADQIQFIILYAVFANVPYWAASSIFGFLGHRGWFCVESIAVGLLALFVPPVLSAALLFLVMAADLLCAVCETYFLSIPECLAYVGVFHAFSGRRKLAAIAVVLLMLLVVAIAACLPPMPARNNKRFQTVLCLIVFSFAIVAADVQSISVTAGKSPNPLNLLGRRDLIHSGSLSRSRFARMPIIRLGRIAVSDASIRAHEKEGATAVFPVPSAAAIALRSSGIASGPGQLESPNLVLVLVESWGLATDSRLNEALVQPYLMPDLRARYDVVQGTVPFYGATIAGEARELCNNSFGFHLLDASASEFKQCIPMRLAALGYRNIALHGMSGYLFRRSTWYKTIGFQEIWFNDRFKQQGMPDCAGAFVGTCDANIAEWIGRRLEEQNSNPYFVHWMTLNSHLPVLVPSTIPAVAPCSSTLSLAPRTPLCSWYRLITNVHQSVSRLSMRKLARPTVFVIVGDHAPPFGDPELSSRFSQTDVPYVLLLPRSRLVVH